MKAKRMSDRDSVFSIYCPGCKDYHTIDERWQFNGDVSKPTFAPSLLIRSGHFAPGHKGTYCWCTYNEEHKDEPAPFKCVVCHSFITDGKIQFLNDCTHELAGQTVELPNLDKI